MVGASKILTVSYGTFSCTLEGFDDPFNTMKAIAEYFRDLAADDRYFGAEPPTPDAAMLHRIAERELQRRVEAKVDDTGVVLRAAGFDPEPAVAPQPAPSAAATLLAEESVAAKLQRIRAAVARAAAAPAPVVEDAVYAEDLVEPAPAPAAQKTENVVAFVPPAAVEPEPVVVEPAPVEAVVETVAEEVADAEDAPEAPVELAAEEELVAVTEPVAEEAAASDYEEDYDVPVEAAAVDAAEEDLAVEAEPIEAVAQTEETVEPFIPAEVATEDDYIEPVAAEAFETEFDEDDSYAEPDAAEEEALIAALAASIPSATTDADDIASPADEQDETPEQDFGFDSLNGILAGLNAGGPAIEVAEAEEIEDAEEVAVADEFEAEKTQAVDPTTRWLEAVEMDAEDAEAHYDAEAVEAVAEAETYDFEAQAEETDESEDEAFEELDAASATTEEQAEEPAPDFAAGEETSIDDKLRRARARVIRVRRPDAAVAQEADDEPKAAAEAEEAPRGEGRAILETQSKADEDVTRLLRQTNSEMEGPENRRRMLTLSHLKAAVAATVAELRSSGKAKEAKGDEPAAPAELDPYRADLASVVRPRRPDGDGADKPAPLVLVSEQRIDPARPVDAIGTRVLPRRVTSGNLAVSHDDEDEDDMPVGDAENIFAQSSSFQEFAERLGATEIQDLLEAAAAYTACFEGRPHFSRPHLLRYVSTLSDGTEVNREDGLRGFGKLLRQGKIEKVKRGQFAITDNSYYLAEARRMVR